MFLIEEETKEKRKETNTPSGTPETVSAIEALTEQQLRTAQMLVAVTQLYYSQSSTDSTSEQKESTLTIVKAEDVKVSLGNKLGTTFHNRKGPNIKPSQAISLFFTTAVAAAYASAAYILDDGNNQVESEQRIVTQDNSLVAQTIATTASPAQTDHAPLNNRDIATLALLGTASTVYSGSTATHILRR